MSFLLPFALPPALTLILSCNSDFLKAQSGRVQENQAEKSAVATMVDMVYQAVLDWG